VIITFSFKSFQTSDFLSGITKLRKMEQMVRIKGKIELTGGNKKVGCELDLKAFVKSH